MGHLKQGFEERFSQSDRNFLLQINDNNGEYTSAKFNSLKLAEWEAGKKKVLVVGDSYAQDLVNAIYESGLDKVLSLSTWPFISTTCGNIFVPYSTKEKFISEKHFKNCY